MSNNTEFVPSPLYDNWFVHNIPARSLIICSPYIKKAALDRIITLFHLNEREDFNLQVLLRGNPDEFIGNKSSDITIFETLQALPCYDPLKVRRITNLHMKAYLVDEERLLIGSGNMTPSGLFSTRAMENFEAALSVHPDDPNGELMTAFWDYFDAVWAQSEASVDFYNELLEYYLNYVRREYRDDDVVRTRVRRTFDFPVRTQFDDQNRRRPQRPLREGAAEIPVMRFSLADLPPVARVEHLLPVLASLNEHDALSYEELGAALRRRLNLGAEADNRTANAKIGEEKGKLAVYFNLARIDSTADVKRFCLTDLGEAYLTMDDHDRNNLMKDAFFDKPVVVSILRMSLTDPGFDLRSFLLANCTDGTDTTLRRKVAPLRDLFSQIRTICTEETLRQLLDI